ncbi:MAG: tetraacyldisaccharide 4'-kinase [Saprospiraceae bacterium]|nr:tetraacyldisaccharide 4'-kinase [Saprospiraceae bacterium]
MFDKLLTRILLLPVSLLFGVGVAIKSLLYGTGLLSGVTFSIPVINVGNLTVGGSGKTPHVEYLIRLLSPYIHIATLSRGYKRSTKGFLLARPGHTADHVGDEPLLFSRKYPHIAVAVSESRALGVPKLLQKLPQIQTIILDDAYQHRAIDPNYNILLTEFDDPFYRDWLLPSGRLREWRSAYKRADVIIVTKCPDQITAAQKESVIAGIRPLPQQRVFFTRYAYRDPYQMWASDHREAISDEHEVLLVCGIARTKYLLDYLHKVAGAVKMLQYEDHHVYSRYDLETIKKYYTHMTGPKRMILTTEKDAMRLEPHYGFLKEHALDVFILPVRVEFLFDDQNRFDNTIRNFLLQFKV